MIQWLDADEADELNRGKIVAMCEHQGRLFVATERRVYEKMEDGKLHPLMFVNDELGMLNQSWRDSSPSPA